MRQPAGMQKYMTNHYDGMTPEQLILMLYKGALQRLALVKQAIDEKNIQKRGENLSKVISIISELNASLNTEGKDESILFLNGLYTAMLMELPKVSLNNDIETLERAERYIARLKEIWENNVMGKSIQKKAQPRNGYGAAGNGSRNQKTSAVGYASPSSTRLNAFAV
ncbi:MAG: flagellar export chaperone FliS [Desulfamplus sp.]|nr:flagellar export chaperone FliS [Desulfamplus sp.]